MEVIEKVAKSKSKAKLSVVKTEATPVVDVPKEIGSDDLIQSFITKNTSAISAYLLKEFEELSEADIKTIVREAAECAVLVRSPKVSDPWGEDVQVIENCIKVSVPVGTAPVTKKKSKSKSKPEAEKGTVTFKSGDKVIGTAKVESIEIKPDQDLKSEKSEPKKKAKTVTTKSTAKPKTTKPETKAVKKSAKAVETKKPNTLKGKAKTDKKKVEVATSKVSVDELKSLKGLDLWLSAGRIIKRTCGTGFIQVHDQETIIPALFEHHHKKTELKDMDGKGNKTYGKRRLENYYTMIVAFFKEHDLKL